MGIGDFNHAFKKMFGARGETKRINAARDLAQAAYRELGLGTDFATGIDAIRHALRIRNQYAHWTWWDDSSGQLAIANLEDLARQPSAISGFDRLHVHHVDMPLLEMQQAYFAYVDGALAWINFEGRFLRGDIRTRIVRKPAPLPKPAFYYPQPSYCRRE